MIGDSLTKENLTAILNTMDKISPIDRSGSYDDFRDEIISRLNDIERNRIHQESLEKAKNALIKKSRD